MFIRCSLYHMLLLYYYAETKEMIYESVNFKGVVKSQNKLFQILVYPHVQVLKA